MPIVWEKPDGSLMLTQIIPEVLERERREGESTEDAVLRIARELIQPKSPVFAGLTPTTVRTADVPPDRSRRHLWRLKGKAIVGHQASD